MSLFVYCNSCILCVYVYIYMCMCMCMCMYIHIYLICIYLYFYVLLLVLSVCTKGLRVTQFQLSVCMYCTCGRIDNKADFDFDFFFTLSLHVKNSSGPGCNKPLKLRKYKLSLRPLLTVSLKLSVAIGCRNSLHQHIQMIFYFFLNSSEDDKAGCPNNNNNNNNKIVLLWHQTHDCPMKILIVNVR